MSDEKITPLDIFDAVDAGEIDDIYHLAVCGVNVNASYADGTTPLHLALDADIIQALLDCGADVNIRDSSGLTPLHCVAICGDVGSALLLVAHGADINARNDFGATPLFNAARGNRVDMMRALIEMGADINVRNDCGRTPLYSAISCDSNEAALLLISLGADITVVDENGETPLQVATKYGRTRVIDAIKARDANSDDNNKDGETGTNNLSDTGDDTMMKEYIFDVVERGDVEKLREMVANGADITVHDSRGRQPLAIAARCGHIAMMDTLLEMGANLFSGRYFDTAIFCAIQYAQTDAVNWLMSHGVLADDRGRAFIAILKDDVDEVKKWVRAGLPLNRFAPFGYTPLMYAARCGSEGTLKYLLTTDCDISYYDDECENITALYYAIVGNHPNAAKILLDAGIDIKLGQERMKRELATASAEMRTIFTDYGMELPPVPDPQETKKLNEKLDRILKKIPDDDDEDIANENIQSAILMGHTDRVRELLESGTDANTNIGGDTLLHIATFAQEPESVRLLIEHGADVNVRDKHDSTPLENSVGYDDIVSTRYLLDAGADVNSRNKRGDTVMHSSYYCKSILRMLLAAGGDVGIPSHYGRLPIYDDLLEFTPDILDEMVERGTDLNQYKYLLHHFARINRPHTIMYLLSQGFDVNVRDEDGETPLMKSLASPTAMMILLAAGADMDARANNGFDALTFALMAQNMTATEMLVEAGATTTDLLPLCRAIWNQDIDALSKMKSDGLDVNRVMPDGRSLLIYALDLKRPVTARWLIENGADIHFAMSNKDMALHYACARGLTDVASMLVSLGADINAIGDEGLTPLHCAADGCHTEIIKMLIDAGANVNVVNDDGDTPAHLAVRFWDDQCMRVLEAGGATLDISNKDGDRAGDIWNVWRQKTDDEGNDKK